MRVFSRELWKESMQFCPHMLLVEARNSSSWQKDCDGIAVSEDWSVILVPDGPKYMCMKAWTKEVEE